jgi:hypothetical protein
MTTPVPPTPVPPRTGNSRTRNAALVVPLVLVNATAVLGQALWAYDHLVPAWVRPSVLAVTAICVLFAGTVESIGVYLAYEAHAAQMNDQAYGGMRVASYGVGLFVGFLNFWHFAGNQFAPNATAITFGLLSSLSPWLWAIRSRSLHRAALLEKGLVDPRSVRFTIAQRVLYPVASFRAYRLAVWNGVNNPAQARADYNAARTGTVIAAQVAASVPPSVPPAVLSPTRVVPPAIEAAVPPAQTATRTAAKPARTPERPTPARPIDTSTADAVVLARLREAYPGRVPSLSEVSAIAGGKQPRAVRLRRLLVDTMPKQAAGADDDAKEREQVVSA